MNHDNREAFTEALELYINEEEPGDPEITQNLHRLCGAVWNDDAAMTTGDAHNVRDAIGNCVEADDWEAKGRTYSGAARRIRPNLKVA